MSKPSLPRSDELFDESIQYGEKEQASYKRLL